METNAEGVFCCQHCGKQFTPRNKYNPSKTCSKECRYALSAIGNARVQNKAVRVTAPCGNPDCTKEITFPESRPKTYCSLACYNTMRAASLETERTCPQCGKTSTNYTRQDQVYCSVVCRNQALASTRTVTYPECKVCGTSTGSHNRVYCDEHRPSPGRPAQPRLVATCWGCGEEFSRPAGYAGKMHYCSNKCSHSEVKSVRDKFVANLNEKTVVFHSGWEVRFWALCLRLDVPVRRYDGPDIETSVGVYRPDFIVGDDVVVEIKGWMDRPGTAEKLDRPNLAVLNKQRFLDAEMIVHPTTLLDYLRIDCNRAMPA